MSVIDFLLGSGDSSTSTDNRLNESLKKWVPPPDPSTNHNITCDIHNGEMVQWFSKGSISAEWESAGSLLWIYGKRFPLHVPSSTSDHLCVLSRLWKEQPLVRHRPESTHAESLRLSSSSTIIEEVLTLRKAGSALSAYFYFDLGTSINNTSTTSSLLSSSNFLLNLVLIAISSLVFILHATTA